MVWLLRRDPGLTPDLVYFPGFFLFIHSYSIWHAIKGKISPPFILLKTTKVARKKAKFFFSSMFTSGPPTFIYCSKLSACLYHPISNYPNLSDWSF